MKLPAQLRSMIDIPWDKAFNALLRSKKLAADFDVQSNLIRVHSPSNLTQQNLQNQLELQL